MKSHQRHCRKPAKAKKKLNDQNGEMQRKYKISKPFFLFKRIYKKRIMMSETIESEVHSIKSR